MAEKYVMFDIDDPRIEKLGEVITNKTCKKILDLLSEKEMSESDLSKKLGLPLNTVGYNISKLLESGLIEKSKSYFWSVKGKKIPSYRVSNKKVLISPKKRVSGVLGTILIGGIVALGIKVFVDDSNSVVNNLVSNANDVATSSGIAESGKVASGIAASPPSYDGGIVQCVNNVSSYASHNWIWFLFGILVGLFLYLILNNLKLKGGK